MAEPDSQSAKELRQQGAIETAQEATQQAEPGIPPEAVEKVLVNETQSAGVPAYQFDPDATPEQKAAAAQAVCLGATNPLIRFDPLTCV